jgi:hypothetical protein
MPIHKPDRLRDQKFESGLRRPDRPHDRGRTGATYVFDKGYCHYGWWTAIADQGAVFLT